ncbi:MAG: NAD(P)-binding domain-containing protein [Bacteroidota bacterium]
MQNDKLSIGFIGAGQIGGTLIRQYTQAGHLVKMANASGVEKLKSLASETGATAVPLTDAVTGVDVLVLSIPTIEVPKLPKNLFQHTSPDTVIIDTCNYYPIRDGMIEELEKGMVESVWVSNHLQRPVIKVYNNIIAASLILSGTPGGTGSRIALPVSGDNKEAKALVSALVETSGFDSFDAGSLIDSWRQQPGSPIYCTDLTRAELKKSIGKARKEILPERRELGLAFILQQNPEQWMNWWRDCVKHNRVIYESELK